VAGVTAWQGGGHEWTAVCRGRFGELQQAATAVGARIVEKGSPSLDEILLAQVGSRPITSAKE
jgi:hypothetical protein